MSTCAVRFLATIWSFSAAAASGGVGVTAVMPDGSPLPGVTVSCGQVTVETSATGTTELPEDCGVTLTCDHPDYLLVETAVTAATVCRMSPALRVAGELNANGCGVGCVAQIFTSRGRNPIASAGVRSTGPDAHAEFALPKVAPGRYRLTFSSASGWACEADLGPLPPGALRVVVPWREPALLRGIVQRPDGKPLPRARVRSFSDRPAGGFTSSEKPEAGTFGAWRCSSPQPPETASDDRGAFQFQVDPATQPLIVAGDEADPRGFDAQVAMALDTPLTLTPRPWAKLSTRIVYADGHPAACRARLTPEHPLASWLAQALEAPLRQACAKDGRVSFGPFPPAPYSLQIEPLPGLLQTREERATPHGGAIDLGAIVVSRGEEAEVIVSDVDGRPVAGAKIQARASSGLILTVEAATGEDGRAHLAGIPGNARVSLSVEARGFRKLWRSDASLAESPYRVTLERAAILSGTVLDTQGAPVPGAKVTLASGRNARVDEGSTDDAGRFELPHAPSGDVEVSAAADGYRAPRPLKLTVLPEEIREDLEIRLEVAPVLTGRVEDERGDPVADARLAIVRYFELEALDHATPGAAAVSDRDGRFSMAPPRDAYSALVAVAPDYAPAVLQPLPTEPSQEVIVTLPRPARLSVLVPDRVSGDASVRVVDGAHVGRSERVGGRARLSFDDLAPGDGSAGLSRGATRSVRLVSGETTEVSLTEGSSIEGTVTHAGAPAAQAVAILSPGGSATPHPDRIEFVDDRGRFRMNGLGAGEYVVMARAPEGEARQRILLPAAGAVSVDLVIRHIALTVVVRNGKTGAPVDGAKVHAVPTSFAGQKQIRNGFVAFPTGSPGFDAIVDNCNCKSESTGASGDAYLVLPEPGRFALTVEAEAFKTWQGEIELREGDQLQQVELEPVLQRTVRVNVETDPPGGYGVLLCLGAGGAREFAWGSRVVECEGLPAGDATVVFRALGLGSASTTVQVPDSGEVETTLTIPRGGELVVAVGSLDTPMPAVVDDNAVNWSEILRHTEANRGLTRRESVPGVGPAWIFSDLPPGRYRAVVDGVPREAVEVASGGRTVSGP